LWDSLRSCEEWRREAYALQAAIAACHTRAGTAKETDWERIVLYDALLQINPGWSGDEPAPDNVRE